MNLLIAFLALLVERLLGYPDTLFKVIGHPVSWIGKLIGMLEKRFNTASAPFEKRREYGALCLATLLVLVFAITVPISLALRSLPFGWLIEAVLASSFLAQKGLGDAVAKVQTALEDGPIENAQEAVSHIVGRDTSALDEPEIARAAIETLAENTSDGVVAPLLYLVIFGLPGIALYKAINTADSMIGHRSERYLAYGWAAAKVDDIANFIPARLTAILFAASALVVSGASASKAWATATRDAKKHASPNAGWPEAAMAGALDFGLGGPRSYQGQFLDLPQMGDGRRDLGATDIGRALNLYQRLLWVLILSTGLAAIFLAL